jgi:hypothetical protein
MLRAVMCWGGRWSGCFQPSGPCPYDGRLGEELKRHIFPAESEKFLPDQMFNFKTNGGKTIKCSQLEKSAFPIS